MDVLTDKEFEALAIAPWRYHERKTSGLRFKVGPRRNEINIALTSPLRFPPGKRGDR